MDPLIRTLESISLIGPDEGFSFVRLAPIPKKDSDDNTYWESYLSMIAGFEKLVTDLEEHVALLVYGSERDRNRLNEAIKEAVVGIRYLARTYKDVEGKPMERILYRYSHLY